MTRPSGHDRRFRSRVRGPEGAPGSLTDGLYEFDRPPAAAALESTWLLLDAADRMELLGEDARATSRRAAEAAQDYAFMAERLRLLASSAPD